MCSRSVASFILRLSCPALGPEPASRKKCVWEQGCTAAAFPSPGTASAVCVSPNRVPVGKRLGESRVLAHSSTLRILALLAASSAALQQPGAELCVCCPLQAKSAPGQACHCSLCSALGAELAQCLGGSGEHYLGSCKNCASE